MLTVGDVSAYLNSIAPYEAKMSWDNCGLLVGDTETAVRKIGFCLDLTPQTLEQAKRQGTQLIITHHPVIFKAQKSFLKGNLAYELAVSGISVLSVHTCYDMAERGVSDVLAELVGLENVRPLNDEDGFPFLRIGIHAPISGKELAQKAAHALGTTVRLADAGKAITEVAVCGGSGGDFSVFAAKSGADAFITGEVSHHQFLDALQAGLTVIAAGHFETENPAIPALMKRIGVAFPEAETVLLRQDNPVEYIG